MPVGDQSDPNAVAALIDREMNPLERSITQIAEEEGLSYSLARKVVERLRRQHPMFQRAIGTVRKTELRDKYLLLADRILDGVTVEDIKKAKLKDKMLSAAIAVDKAQLLDGLPTDIYSVKELEHMPELTSLLLKELDRRGMSAQQNEATGQVTVLPDPDAGNRRDPREKMVLPGEEPA